MQSCPDIDEQEAKLQSSSWRTGAKHDKDRKKYSRAKAIVDAISTHMDDDEDLLETVERIQSQWVSVKAFKKEHDIKI